jgi:hypothetical protein
VSGGRDGTHFNDSSFPDPSMIGLLPGQDVTRKICNFQGMVSRVPSNNPNDVAVDVTTIVTAG